MKSVRSCVCAVTISFLGACGSSSADTVTEDGGSPTSAGCTTADGQIVALAEATLASVTRTEAAADGAMASLAADLKACTTPACDLADIQKQLAILLVSAPSLKATACPAHSSLKTLSPTLTAALHADAVADFDVTCKYAEALVVLNGELQKATAGTASITALQSTRDAAQAARELGAQLPLLNAKVQAGLDLKPCAAATSSGN